MLAFIAFYQVTVVCLSAYFIVSMLCDLARYYIDKRYEMPTDEEYEEVDNGSL